MCRQILYSAFSIIFLLLQACQPVNLFTAEPDFSTYTTVERNKELIVVVRSGWMRKNTRIKLTVWVGNDIVVDTSLYFQKNSITSAKIKTIYYCRSDIVNTEQQICVRANGKRMCDLLHFAVSAVEVYIGYSVATGKVPVVSLSQYGDIMWLNLEGKYPAYPDRKSPLPRY